MLSFFRQTPWKFVTSGGLDVDVGISKILFVSGQGGALYVAHNSDESAIWRLPYAGAGGGAGLAVSAGAWLSLSLSLPVMPGSGVFQIYQPPSLFSRELKISDMSGAFLMYSGSLAVGGSVGISLVFMGAPQVLVTAVSAASGPLALQARLAAVLATCSAVGILYGTAATSSAGISGQVITGHIFSPSRAAPGETG